MSDIDWKKVADILQAEAALLQDFSEAKPDLELARMSAPAILVLKGIARAIDAARSK
jgi:hypothetical protein